MFLGGLPSPAFMNGPASPAYIDDMSSPPYIEGMSSLVWVEATPSPTITRKMSNEGTKPSDETVVKTEAIKKEPEPPVIDLTAVESPSPQTPSTSKTLMPLTPATQKGPIANFGPFKVPQLHLPPTPASTPMKGTNKRPLPLPPPTSEPLSPLASRSSSSSTTDSGSKAALETTSPSPAPKRPRRSSSHTYCRNPRYVIIDTAERGPVKIYQKRLSSLELERLANELMFQVDWETLEEYVACNRPGIVYRRLVRNMILNRARELAEEEVGEMGDVESSASEDDEEEVEGN